MQNVTNPTVKTHVVWLDVVRLIAMFTVVCCHCTDPFNFYPGDSPIIGDIKFWGAAYGAFLRPCVPLFVMITGALLLPVREETSIFYKKRILRVFWPFLIWSVIYGTAWFEAGTYSGFLPLFGRRGDSSIVECVFRLYRPDTVQFLIVGCTYVVYLFTDRFISLFADLLRLGRESFG